MPVAQQVNVLRQRANAFALGGLMLKRLM